MSLIYRYNRGLKICSLILIQVHFKLNLHVRVFQKGSNFHKLDAVAQFSFTAEIFTDETLEDTIRYVLVRRRLREGTDCL